LDTAIERDQQQDTNKFIEARNLFTARNIEALLQHADDPTLEGKLDNNLAMKLFLIVVLDKILMPSVGYHANSEIIHVVQNLEDLKSVH